VALAFFGGVLGHWHGAKNPKASLASEVPAPVTDSSDCTIDNSLSFSVWIGKSPVGVLLAECSSNSGLLDVSNGS
jgi:hypothetical protein